MIIEKALKNAGLTMEGDTLPKKDRKVKTFQRLIAAVRAAEAAVLDDDSASKRALNESLQQTLLLQERVHTLESELRKYKFSERLQEIGSLTTADRTKLLDVAAA